ncbi:MULTISPECIES: TolC family protein [Arcobacteraceae]|uniref:Outer membrane efflux protein n=3 Tax=Arcobacteraceae TaxID=2808963 RepID=A0A1C0B9Z6_9BACT|nr:MULTISPECIES: TolC family protein [Arcobacteraceae]OCL84214.1 Outer membrane efflux protein [Arcobacter porcinus]OCL89278.1 Outer membrane efflux protein [Arcobacter porcinus]OCL91698.1 Outer membrane efflux protein [Arcobacter porcinus]OCL91934.1 Outer membrane efflux protein [Aliarcobacter thereius]OCL94968.1 Outer membrane efflux protein [Aliarcobacter thereius LMG 24486]
MKKIVLALFIICNFIYALTIDEIVSKSLEQNYDIRSLENSIEIASKELSRVKKWQNPVLGFSLNNISLHKDDNAMKMNKEYGVSLSQTIPIGSKLSLEKDIAQKDEEIKKLELEDKKLELESKIYQYSYTILVLENKRELLNEYQKNLQRVKDQYLKMYESDKVTFNELLNSEISNYDVEVLQNELENQISNLYLNLELITYLNVDKIEDNIALKEIDDSLLKDFQTNHPKIEILRVESTKQNSYSKLEDAKKFSELTLSLEYMQDDEQNWANVMINFPLPIYNTENINKLKAKINSSEIKNKEQSQVHNLKLQNKILLNNIELSRKNLALLQEEIIPKKIKLQKVLEEFVAYSKLSFGDNLKNLNELISYELKANEELAKYFENYSELIYYSNKGIK